MSIWKLTALVNDLRLDFNLFMSYCYIFIMIDVKLTSSGFDRLPVCMDG